MARFLLSPGVLTREVDNSQYASTNPGLGNMAALIGYAERGPFEPTTVSGLQKFAETFGFTLANAPYLYMAAEKYFETNDQLLVVRAGSDQDPDAYPTAAQYSSIKLRLEPTSAVATAGYQTFSATEALAPGTFSNGASYGFKVLSDYRGFSTPKYVEAWNGMAVETASSMGPSPVTSIYNTVFKIAKTTSDSSTFIANYKREHNSSGTSEYSGTGNEAGKMFGDAVSATLYKYLPSADSSDYITMTGSHAANVVGDANLLGGYDFSLNSESFNVSLGTTQYTITLDQACGDIDAVIAEINSKLAVADDGIGTVDLTSVEESPTCQLYAVKLQQTTTDAYVMLKKTGGSNTGFTLSAGTTDALAVLGFTAGEYTDEQGIVGTWHAEAPVAGTAETFDGTFGYNLMSVNASALSFEENINVSVTAPTSGSWELSDVVSQISAELALAYDGSHTDDALVYSTTAARASVSIVNSKIQIITSDVASETSSFVRISQPGSGNSLITLLGGVDQPKDGIAPASVGEAVYTISAAEKGSYGQKLMLRTETEKVTLGTQQLTYNNIYVLLDGYEERTYQKVVWDDPSDSNFFLTRMADDPFINIEIEDEDEDAIYAQIPDGDWMLGQNELPEGVDVASVEIMEYNVGTNGWTETDGIITSMSADFDKALKKIYNPEIYEFNLVAAPGTADPIVQNSIQSLCESRRDCFGIVDAAPFGIGLGIKQGINDVTEVTAACGTITSSYVGAFWPWLQDYDSINEQYVWLPPSIYALKSMVYTDSVADPWYAPAGTTRGKVSALDVEYSPTRTDRDLLYGDTNIVNPIVYFVSEGITIWGQKTGQRTLSATNRINVRRLLIYAEKLIAKMARGFLFEPNDSANWAAFTRQANAILEPIRQRRGLYTYSVVCDETTNTASLINQNIMAGKIFVQPTKTTEFIEVEFTINAAGDVTVSE